MIVTQGFASARFGFLTRRTRSGGRRMGVLLLMVG